MKSSQPELIAGRYQVRERLGQGGMGVVYLAHDQELPRLVAVKLLRDNDPDLHERFAREARLAASLDHPNIVTIYDRGIHDGQPFIVMQYITGESLDELIRRRAPLSLARKVQMIADLCEGLAFAHRAGVVHRDVKPANIKISQEGVLKILDFGIARQVESGMTRAGSMIGTISYMSPEQVSGEPVDHRSDQFSVGLVLYELLTFEKAFPGDERIVPSLILTGEPKLLQTFDAHLDPALIRVVTRALRKNPNERYPDLQAMRKELLRLAERLESNSPHLVAAPHEGVMPTMIVKDKSSRSAGPRSDVGRFAERRRAQIEALIERAQRAFAQGDLDSVISAGEQAAVLDPDDERVHDLLSRASSALDHRQMRAWLNEAQQQIDLGAVTAASELVARSLELMPNADEALAFQARLRVLQLERERAAQREHGVKQALDYARAALREGALESAIRSAGEALAHDPTSRDAEDIRAQARRELEGRRVQQVEDARRAAEENARREAEAHRAAEAELRHRAEAEAVSRRTSEAAAMRRAEEEAAERRHREIEDRLATAATALLRGDLQAAVGEVQSLKSLGASPKALDDLLAKIERSRATRVDNQKREEYDRRATDVVNASRLDFAAGRIESALRQLETFAPPHPLVTAALAGLRQETEAAERQKKSQSADAEARRRREIAEFLAEAGAHLDAGQYSKAMNVVDMLLAREPRQQDAFALRESIRAAQANADVDARAKAVVAEARDLATAGRYTEALTCLEQFSPAHTLIDHALKTLRVIADAWERRADDTVAEARRLFESAGEAEALTLLEEFSPPHPSVNEALIGLRRTLQSQEQEAAPTLMNARALEQQGNLTAAFELLERVKPASPSVRTALSALRDRRAQQERERRALEQGRTAEHDKHIRQIRTALSRRRLDAAEQLLQVAWSAFPDSAELDLLKTELGSQRKAAAPGRVTDKTPRSGASAGRMWMVAAAVMIVASGAAFIWLRPSPPPATTAVPGLQPQPASGPESVTAAPLAPTPAPAPTPTPLATSTPAPTSTPVPTSTQAPLPVPLSTPPRVPIPSPFPTPVPPVEQTSRSLPAPVPAATPEPTQTPAPVLSPSPAPTLAPALPPSPVPTPVAVPAVVGVPDEVLREVLDRFSRAWGSGKVDQFRQAFPSLKERTEALQSQMRGACSAVSVEFSSIEVQNRTAKSARVETRSLWGCKMKVAGGRLTAQPSTDLFDLVQSDNGTWTITRMFLGGV